MTELNLQTAIERGDNYVDQLRDDRYQKACDGLETEEMRAALVDASMALLCIHYNCSDEKIRMICNDALAKIKPFVVGVHSEIQTGINRNTQTTDNPT